MGSFSFERFGEKFDEIVKTTKFCNANNSADNFEFWSEEGNFQRNFKIKKVEVFFVRSYRNWSFALGVNDENHESRKIIISLRDL